MSGVILEVGEDRDTSSIEQALYYALMQSQLGSINTVSMDMLKPYMKSIEGKVPNAEFIHDKFHLVNNLNNSISKVRRREV